MLDVGMNASGERMCTGWYFFAGSGFKASVEQF